MIYTFIKINDIAFVETNSGIPIMMVFVLYTCTSLFDLSHHNIMVNLCMESYISGRMLNTLVMG